MASLFRSRFASRMSLLPLLGRVFLFLGVVGSFAGPILIAVDLPMWGIIAAVLGTGCIGAAVYSRLLRSHWELLTRIKGGSAKPAPKHPTTAAARAGIGRAAAVSPVSTSRELLLRDIVGSAQWGRISRFDVAAIAPPGLEIPPEVGPFVNVMPHSWRITMGQALPRTLLVDERAFDTGAWAGATTPACEDLAAELRDIRQWCDDNGTLMVGILRQGENQVNTAAVRKIYHSTLPVDEEELVTHGIPRSESLARLNVYAANVGEHESRGGIA